METALQGRLALVTGGASGIGRAVADLLAAEGARPVLADRDATEGAAAAQALDARFQLLDVGDEAAVATVVAEVEESYGAIDVLVTCAGVLQRTLPPSRLSWKEWDRVQRVHLRGTYACCREVGSRMAARGRGSIVTIASVAGLASGPLHSYGPAKAAIITLTEGLAAEWGRSGVRVNAVAPGFTKTPALARGLADGTLTSVDLSEASALGRLVAPEEIARAVVFLASDLSSAMTGTVLTVDAGYLVAAPWAAYGGLRSR